MKPARVLIVGDSSVSDSDSRGRERSTGGGQRTQHATPPASAGRLKRDGWGFGPLT
jgi:hypothetical protein